MLTQQYQRLRIGKDPNFKKRIVQTIPVLSIFVLLGIISTSLLLFDDSFYGASDAHAAEGDNTTASLVIDNGSIRDTVQAGVGEFVYATHKVSVEANNIKSYSLKLSGPTTITSNGTTLNGANNTVADNLSNQWGYAWIAENADPTTATYQSLTTTSGGKELNDIAINSTTHNLSGVKQLVFGAKFNDTAANGTYHAEATLSLVATPYTVMNYSLVYDANGGSGAPATQTYKDETNASSHSFTVLSTIPTRSGYTFLGWADSNTATSAQYAAGNSITVNKATTGTTVSKTVYAVWQQSGYTYKIIYKPGDNRVFQSAIEDQIAVSTSTSYQMTIISSAGVYYGSNSCPQAVRKWTGDDGVTYTPSQTVTLTSSKPILTLTASSFFDAGCWD